MSAPKSVSEWFRTDVSQILRWVGRFLTRSDRLVTTLAFIIGTVTGLGAIGFSLLVEQFSHLYYGQLRGILVGDSSIPWLLPLLPMSGALLVGLITWKFAPEAEGHGVPEVMYAMAKGGGRIRPRVAGAKAIASALTIGSGGSAGTEGPIIQIGAAIGSGFGQWLRVSLSEMRVLIGCGAAAGIASIFNAPIAGVLFAVEVLLRDVSLQSFVPIIISAVMSSTITQAVRDSNDPIFPVPHELKAFSATPIDNFSVYEFGNYLVLGLICGVAAAILIRTLYWSEDSFRKIPVHRVMRPVFGAMLLGLLAIAMHMTAAGKIPHVRSETTTGARITSPVEHEADPPPVMGNGYPVIRQTLERAAYRGDDQWVVIVLLMLFAAKAVATCLTLGSGGSGGVFAPSLFLGATLGGGFGLLVQQLAWFGDSNPGSYALVGMAAVVASSIHAPLTAALMLFELTRDYTVIIPIMLAAVSGLAVARALEPTSIYTKKLIRRGVLSLSSDARILQRISVRELPRIVAPLVSPDDPVDKLVRMMRSTSANDFLVVDTEGQLVGMVLGDDLRMMLLESEAMPLLTVSDVVRHEFPTVHPDETLDVVLDKFAGRSHHSIPVVDPARKGPLELITRTAVMNRYHQALAHGRAVV